MCWSFFVWHHCSVNNTLIFDLRLIEDILDAIYD